MLSHPQILNTHSVNIFPGLDSACIALAKWSSFALRNGQIYFTPWRQKGYTRLGIRSYMLLLFLQTMIFLMFPTCLVLRYRSISYTPIIYWGHAHYFLEVVHTAYQPTAHYQYFINMSVLSYFQLDVTPEYLCYHEHKNKCKCSNRRNKYCVK
jgi:hypothetical protein